MRECDNSKIHISSNFLLSVCLIIMLDNLLLVPSLHCNTSLHFTTLHFTTLIDTLLPPFYSGSQAFWSHLRRKLSVVSEPTCARRSQLHHHWQICIHARFFLWSKHVIIRWKLVQIHLRIFTKIRYFTFLHPVRSNAKVSKVVFIGLAVLQKVGTGKQGMGSGVGSRVISGTVLNVEHHLAPRT